MVTSTHTEESTAAVPRESWHRGMYLTERPVPPTSPDGVDAELGQRRLRRWTSTLGAGVSLDGALRCAGISSRDLVSLLAASGAEPAPALPPPAWLDKAAAACAAGATDDHLVAENSSGLLRPADRLLRGYQRAVHDEVAAIVSGSVHPERLAALPRLLASAWPQEALAQAVPRVVVLELNVARVRGRLTQATPEQRFAGFIADLARPEAERALWVDYPVLLRYANDVLSHWREMCGEFAARLVADLTALDAMASAPNGLGAVREVSFGSGDTHRRGRSVAIVRFDHDRIVYKPRPLDADRAWSQVLAWFNASDPRLRLSEARVVSRPEYGWVEFVEHRSCATTSELAAFYWRLGALLALLHALNATDMHAENVIARAADPVVVDLEALCTPRSSINAAEPVEPDPATRLMRDSVTAIGLLPSRVVIRGAGPATVFEGSAVATPESQMTMLPVPVAVGQGTDAMRYADERVAIPQLGASRPRLSGNLVEPAEFTEELIAGFIAAYRAIVADRDRWLDPGGLLDRFADVPLRYIARGTSYYSRTLMDSLHPDHLRDAAERDRVLARLARGADGSGAWERLVPSEIADLRGGDIPFFECRPASRDLWDSRGRPVAEFLDQPPIAMVRERVTTMSESMLAAQTDLIRHTFDALTTGADHAPRRLALPADPLTPEEARDAALDLARELVRRSMRDSRGIGWAALHFVDEMHWQVGPAGLDLYGGVAGTGLFLSTVADVTGDAEVGEAADLLGDMVRRRCAAFTELLAGQGADGRRQLEAAMGLDAGVFGVPGGLVYYLAHASARHGRADMLETAEQLLAPLADLIERDATHDVISGAAGAILACLALDAARPTGAARDLAARAATRLLDHAERVDGGLAWRSAMGYRPLLGMSHGAAGIAYALARLHAVAPRPEYAEAIEAALRYEAECFDPEHGNWPDFRRPEYGGSPVPLSAWCHGAPGVALARLGLLRAPLPSQVHRLAEADVAAAERLLWRSTLELDGGRFASIGSNVLCHGDVGNLEALLLAAARRGDEEGRGLCLRALRAIVDQGRAEGYLTGPVSPAGVPGLMYGLAGIGYGLLRLTDLDAIPSVLMLDPPTLAPSGQGSELPARTPSAKTSTL